MVGSCESGNEIPSPIKCGNSLTSSGPGRFSRRTLFHSHCRRHKPFWIRDGQLGYRGSIPGRNNCCFSYPERQARPCNQNIFMFGSYRGHVPLRRDDQMWDWSLTSSSVKIKHGWSYTPTPPHSAIARIKTLPLRCENVDSAQVMCKKVLQKIWIMFLSPKLSK